MSDRKIPEGWQTSSGLAVDNADVTIEEVVFRYDANYNNGDTLVAVFTMRGGDGEEIEQFFPCGKNWEPADKGARARHDSGKTKGFNRSSAYGKWCDSALATDAFDVITERGLATEAAVWIGLRFHVVSEKESFTIGGETRERTSIVATKFLGVDGDTKTPSESKPSSSTASGPAKEQANGDGGGLSPALRAKLAAIAKKHDTHDGFMEEAFGVDGVLSDSIAEQAVMDTSDGGLYASARA